MVANKYHVIYAQIWIDIVVATAKDNVFFPLWNFCKEKTKKLFCTQKTKRNNNSVMKCKSGKGCNLILGRLFYISNYTLPIQVFIVQKSLAIHKMCDREKI